MPRVVDPIFEDTSTRVCEQIAVRIAKRILENETLRVLVAKLTLDTLSEVAGGRELYIPAQGKGYRDKAIRDMFNGRNINEIVRKLGVGRSTVYRVLKRTHKTPTA